jgi:hypothetical protein
MNALLRFARKLAAGPTQAGALSHHKPILIHVRQVRTPNSQYWVAQSPQSSRTGSSPHSGGRAAMNYALNWFFGRCVGLDPIDIARVELELREGGQTGWYIARLTPAQIL